jgi:hypothetical protein
MALVFKSGSVGLVRNDFKMQSAIASLAFASSDPNYERLSVWIPSRLLGLEIVLKVDSQSEWC